MGKCNAKWFIKIIICCMASDAELHKSGIPPGYNTELSINDTSSTINLAYLKGKCNARLFIKIIIYCMASGAVFYKSGIPPGYNTKLSINDI